MSNGRIKVQVLYSVEGIGSTGIFGAVKTGLVTMGATFQSLNAGFIFIFAPFVAWLWVWLAKKNWEPSTPVKFAFGVFGAGLGYMVLVFGMKSSGAAALTPVFFIFAIYWVHTMAELMLSPVGLSAMTKLAPARLVGLFMAGWFVYSGLGNALSGVIAAAAGAETVGGQIVDVECDLRVLCAARGRGLVSRQPPSVDEAF